MSKTYFRISSPRMKFIPMKLPARDRDLEKADNH